MSDQDFCKYCWNREWKLWPEDEGNTHSGYYSAFQRKPSLTHATTKMYLEDITLSEINQSQKTNTVWFHLDEVPRVVMLIETESRREISC